MGTERTKEVQPVARRKPPAAGKGRPAGSKNKTTTALKEAILLAGEQVGEDGKGKGGLVGYLRKLATSEPKSYAAILGKTLPLDTRLANPDGSPLQGLAVAPMFNVTLSTTESLKK